MSKTGKCEKSASYCKVKPYKHNKKYCPCFRGDAFVEYINNFVLEKDAKERAKVLEEYITDYDKSLPSIWF